MEEIVHIGNADISVKEYKGKRVVTFKDIDTAHERPEGTARKSFARNRKYFILGKDYFVLQVDEAMKLFNITAPSGLALITEQGYSMIVKPFGDDLSWAVQRQLVDGYFRAKTCFEDLSPKLQMLYGMLDQMADVERGVREAKQIAQNAVESVENVKEAVKPVFDNWREETTKKIARVQKNCGQPFAELKGEMYRELERRAGCDLNTRLRNKKQRMQDSGSTKTAIDKVGKIDCIEEDKKLKEIFSKIVSEYAIRYCA